jgi:hypothetical protein
MVYSQGERPIRGLGGDGGQGGNGGNVTLSFLAENEEVLNLFIVVTNPGGQGGLSGTPKEDKNPSWFYQQEKYGAPGKQGYIEKILLKR